MKFNKNNAKILLIGLVILIIISIQEPAQKEAVADVEGQSCSVDTDCPCFGKIEGTSIEAYGIGASTCTDKKVCDTTYCIDVQPVGEWARDHPWQWIKNNPLIILAAIGLIILWFNWNKWIRGGRESATKWWTQ